MRDPDRIALVLESIESLWKQYPDLRLGQFLLNVSRDPELYYIEDEELVERMQEVYNAS